MTRFVIVLKIRYCTTCSAKFVVPDWSNSDRLCSHCRELDKIRQLNRETKRLLDKYGINGVKVHKPINVKVEVYE